MMPVNVLVHMAASSDTLLPCIISGASAFHFRKKTGTIVPLISVPLSCSGSTISNVLHLSCLLALSLHSLVHI